MGELGAMTLKKSTLRRRGYGMTPRELAIVRVRIAYNTPLMDRPGALLHVARFLIAQATRIKQRK